MQYRSSSSSYLCHINRKYKRDAFSMNVFAFIVKERINEELAPIMADCLTYLEMNNGVT